MRSPQKGHLSTLESQSDAKDESVTEKSPNQSFTQYSALSQQVANSDTVTDLFKLANSDGFKNAAHALSPDDLKSLRTIYRERMRELDGKVRLTDYVGQTLVITDVSYWHSDQWGNDGVTLRFHVDGTTQSLKALTSSAPVVRVFSGIPALPTEQEPIRILLDQRPVRDPARAAQGQKVFTVKRLPNPTHGDGSEGAPF